MQTVNEVRDVVTKVIADILKLEPAQVIAAQSLRELPSIDSIHVLRIVTRLETQLRIELDEQIVFSVSTLEELAREVHGCCQAKPSQTAEC
jgi:acyl carrier protein